VSPGERLLRAARDVLVATFFLLFVPACGGQAIAEWTYVCGTVPPSAPAPGVCGAGDPNLPPEPTLPTDVCQTLVADKTFPDENNLDTARIQAALSGCKGRTVKLVSNGNHNAFVAGHLAVDSVILWVDAGTTLYASRNAELYQKTGSCGKPGINDSSACNDFITMSGTRPGIVGDGVIDGQAGEPLVGHDYSWWQLSGALRAINGSIGNPTLINTASNTSGVLLYRITLHDSPKFHVKLTSVPPDGTCSSPGEGYIVWGITILTPRHWINSQGLFMTPHFARNTDGVDPGTTDIATCGVIACNTISTGDDQIAIKGGHRVSDLIIAHNHFGTGHGMSIGSETYGDQAVDGTPAVGNVLVYDLTIDADSRPVGHDSSSADSNGIRVKSDPSRGGLVTNITFRDVCMRDQANAILVSTAYNPLFPGNLIPKFGSLNFENIRHVSCMELKQPVVTLEGFSAQMRAGPIKLDNVVIDNFGPGALAAEFVDIRLGPGRTNFVPTGPGVVVSDEMSGNGPAKECTFPKLPVPELPPGWLR
jgi:polygalacturonase